MTSYSTTSDADPCTYTFCKTSSDICKLRIDFDTMVLSGPTTISSTAVATDSARVGHCHTDSMTISNPGGSQPPTICGYNTGQHMYVTASDQCNQINIDIDTGSTSTTRQWQIKVTQYECGNMMAPEQDCLQYFTASTGRMNTSTILLQLCLCSIGTIASFNWDTSATTVATTQYHLVNQHYDICIRRARGYCSICYDPYITGSGTTAAASYGLSGSGLGPAMTSSYGPTCSGITTINPTAGSNNAQGDYLEIVALQPGTGTSSIVQTPGTATDPAAINRICGVYWRAAQRNPAPTAITAHATACSYAVPFRVGVHMDDKEAIGAPQCVVIDDIKNIPCQQ